MSAKWQWDSAATTSLYFSLQPQGHLIAPWDNAKRQRYVNWYLCHGGLGLCFTLQHTYSTTTLSSYDRSLQSQKPLKVGKAEFFLKGYRWDMPSTQLCLLPCTNANRGNDWVVLHLRTWYQCSFCSAGEERLGFPQQPQLCWMCRCVSSPWWLWPPHGLLLSAAAEAAETHVLAIAITFAGSWPHWKPSTSAGLTVISCAPTTRRNTHWSLCPWSAL